MAVNARSTFSIDLPGNKIVLLSLKESSFDPGLRTALGLTIVKDGEVPAGKTLVGRGRLAAMQNGCFGVNLVYRKGNKSQTAKVLCSPTKADTVFQEAISKTYNSKNIVEVRVPRRRIFTF